jgi:hypothetical protein
MAVSAGPAGPSTVTKVMIAMIGVMAIILVVITAIMWRAGRSVTEAPVTAPSAVVDVHSTFAYAYGLAQSLQARCGSTRTKSLVAASDAEKQADAALYARALAEAEARAQNITTEKSCDYVISEIEAGERRAAAAHY